MRKYTWTQMQSIILELKMNKIAVVFTDTTLALLSRDDKGLYQLKKRSAKKKLILFISCINQIDSDLPDDLLSLVNAFWPGPLTVIYNSVSYRKPNVPSLLSLLDELGPIYSTSANISNQPVLTNFNSVLSVFKDNLHQLIFIDPDQHISPLNQPSTVYDYDQKTLVRKGPISFDQIKQYVPIS